MNYIFNILAKTLILLVIFCIALIVGLIYLVKIYYFLIIFWINFVGIDSFFDREIYHDFFLYFVANDCVDFITQVGTPFVSIIQ